MTDLEALKARLRETWCGRSGMHDRHEINPDGPEAADAIERLEAENAKLRASLEPFAFREMEKDEGLADTQYVWETIHSDRVQDWFSYEEIEAARAALKG